MNIVTKPEIRYYRKEAYGVTRFYPKGIAGKAIKALTGKKTINENDIEALKLLGFEVKQAKLKYTR